MILSVCPNPSIDIYIWIDAITNGKVNRAIKEQRFPGGKGVHVALALAEMGKEVTLSGFWGGPTGQWIRDECLKKGIQSTGMEVNGWSRTCQSFKSENALDETEILGLGPEIDPIQQAEFDRLIERLVPVVSCVSMSGSWPEGSSPDAYARLISICHAVNKPVFIDGSGKQMEQALATRPYLVHMNTHEAGEIFGNNEPVTLVKELARHCQIGAITTGKEGLYLCGGRQIIHANVLTDRCFSAVGSGDCLHAGLIIAYQENMDLRDSARLGVACGAANCLRPDLGMLYRSDVDKLFKQVKIKVF